ncbi:PAS domain S-box protein [Pullulanibacillus sp. KACC 23026]|uniref:PAS domain S-box protein n=1 Tax=Pullulanibacillus sp. KACC 23026 TaxID=3028315 RepID=UPI0023B00A52|nr:PAS domain S-box protein [Pullulanibacillus sp. KACC 23026]WEG13023.1 PAS domain S-box protein [Pullulanibacillus sp. KACC 23026]
MDRSSVIAQNMDRSSVIAQNRMLNINVNEIPSIHFLLDSNLTIQHLSQKGIEVFELPADYYLHKLNFMDLAALTDRALVQDYFEVLEENEMKESGLRCRLVSQTGKIEWYDLQMRRGRDSENIIYYNVYCRNCTNIVFYEQFLESEKKIIEAIVKNWGINETMDLIATEVEMITSGTCSIMLLEDKAIHFSAAPSLSADFHNCVLGFKIGPAESMIGQFLYRPRAIMTPDIRLDPIWLPHKDKILEWGFTACWSNPIVDHSDQAIGALVIFNREPRSPSKYDLKAIDLFSHLVELAVRHHQIRQSELQKSEEIYRMIAENTSDIIVLFDREGTITYASPSIQEIFGYANTLITGKNIWDSDIYIETENKEKIMKAIGSKIKMNFVMETRNNEGRKMIIESSSSPILNSDGEIENCVIVSRDITERERAKQEIERLHYQNDSILHAAGDGIYGIDPEGLIIFCNHSAATILGYEANALIGKSVHQILHIQQTGPLAQILRTSKILRSLREKETFQSDRELFVHKEGHLIPVEFIASPIMEHGEVTGTVVTFRNICDRLKQEAEGQRKVENFRKQQQALQELNVNIHDYPLHEAIKIMNEKSVEVLDIDGASVWMYSEDKQELVCQDLFEQDKQKHSSGKRLDVLPIPNFYKSINQDRVFVLDRGDHLLKEFVAQNLKANQIHSVVVAPLFTGKRLIGLVAFSKKENRMNWDYDEQNFVRTMADLLHLLIEKDERLKTEELLRKTEKLSVVGQLAAGVAHEIRNPLTSLKGFLQLMSDRNESEEQEQFYEIMLSEIDRIHFISGELLLLAKPQAHHFSEVELVNMCQQVLKLFETEAHLHNVQFEFYNQIEHEEAWIEGQPDQLKQVLVNIIKNGIEAMSASGGIMTVYLRLINGYYEIAIQDQGVGISEERMEKLGEPFYTTKEKGTGLGLMVSYRIIEAHRGTIKVKSQLNVGTTIKVRLPQINKNGIITNSHS